MASVQDAVDAFTEEAKPRANRGQSSAIVTGFVGGHVRSDDVVHREVQLAKRLGQTHPTSVHVEVFANRQGKEACKETLRLLDRNNDGVVRSWRTPLLQTRAQWEFARGKANPHRPWT
jgi:hypothetical protein